MINIIGDGGHAKVVKDIIALRMLEDIQGEYFFVAVGNNADRKMEAERQIAKPFCYLAHPSAEIAQDVEIQDGTVVMAGVVIQPGCNIGKHVILNTNCTVDHDCIIGDYAHIAPGAVLCGNVQVGEGALVGAGAVCVPGAIIPPWSLVKAGTVAK